MIRDRRRENDGSIYGEIIEDEDRGDGERKTMKKAKVGRGKNDGGKIRVEGKDLRRQGRDERGCSDEKEE